MKPSKLSMEGNEEKKASTFGSWIIFKH